MQVKMDKRGVSEEERKAFCDRINQFKEVD